MLVRIKKLTKTAKMPIHSTPDSAGYDLFVDNSQATIIPPGEVVPLQTGLAMEIPSGYYGAVYARSGLSTRQGLRPPMCVGVIDADCRGNICVPLRNDTNVPQVVEPFERVAQIVIQPCLQIEFLESDNLSETTRGIRGFGSTGKQ